MFKATQSALVAALVQLAVIGAANALGWHLGFMQCMRVSGTAGLGGILVQAVAVCLQLTKAARPAVSSQVGPAGLFLWACLLFFGNAPLLIHGDRGWPALMVLLVPFMV